VSGYTPEDMIGFGTILNASIDARLSKGLDANDQPAAQLTTAYARYKRRIGKTGIRDWSLTGRLRRSMKVLSGAPNKAVLGFTDAITNLKAVFNNRRVRQYGVSPTDRKVLARALQTSPKKPVEAKAA
jgi:hypothetical protein